MTNDLTRRTVLATTAAGLGALTGCGGPGATDAGTTADGTTGDTSTGAGTTADGTTDATSTEQRDCEELLARGDADPTCELVHRIPDSSPADAESLAFADLTPREQCIFERTLDGGSFTLGYTIGVDVPDDFTYEEEATYFAVTYRDETHPFATSTRNECPAL